MTSPDDRIAELEKKFAYHEKCYLEQIRYFARRVRELQHEVDQLSSLRTDLQAVETLALDAYAASNEKTQDALFEVDDIVPLKTPSMFFNQLPTIREARRKS